MLRSAAAIPPERGSGNRRQIRFAPRFDAVAQRVSGRKPCDRPNQTRTTASGMITNCGRMTLAMILFANCERFSVVSPTSISTPTLGGVSRFKRR
jgi:hypothetical protein